MLPSKQTAALLLACNIAQISFTSNFALCISIRTSIKPFVSALPRVDTEKCHSWVVLPDPTGITP